MDSRDLVCLHDFKYSGAPNGWEGQEYGVIPYQCVKCGRVKEVYGPLAQERRWVGPTVPVTLGLNQEVQS